MTVSSQLNAAFARHQSGDIDGAIALYREILSGEPQQPDALHMLGVAAQQKGNAQLALQLIDMALAASPVLPMAAHNRSIVLQMLGRSAEAMRSAEQATALDPHHAEAWKMRGILARELNDPIQACAHHRHALQLQPGNATLLSEYALSLYANGDLPEAYETMQEALRCDGNLPPLTLANILKSMGHPERALSYYRRTRELMPKNNELFVNEAVAHLQMGDFAEGWKLWEKRPDLDTRYHTLPLWNGEAVEHLLLYEDQGIGDSLQFVRYLPLLKDKARKITLQVPAGLHKLLAANLKDVTVIPNNEEIPKTDARLRLASLPAWHGTRLDTIPAGIPYLQASEEWRTPWRHRLSTVAKPRIGLVWAGNPNNHNDHNRSLVFAQLAPIIEAGGAHLVSLQKGPAKAEADFTGSKVFDAEPYLTDFAATAGLMAELDLVISVCTAPIHLAGAMGRPGWLMLCFDPHWAWMLGREDSPWYPHLRFFRQSAPGDWAGVVSKVAADLQKFLRGDVPVLKPQAWTMPPLRQNPHALSLVDI